MIICIFSKLQIIFLKLQTVLDGWAGSRIEHEEIKHDHLATYNKVGFGWLNFKHTKRIDPIEYCVWKTWSMAPVYGLCVISNPYEICFVEILLSQNTSIKVGSFCWSFWFYF